MAFNRLFKSTEKGNKPDLQQEETPPGSNTIPQKQSTAQDEETASEVETRNKNKLAGPFYEKDNRAFRILRFSQASDFWNEYEKTRPWMPFLRYVFGTQLQAIDALLSITCIHQACDTGHLICTEPITVGCYRILDGRYEVFLAGEKLAYRFWSEASEKFPSHHGQYRSQLKPESDERFKFQRLASEKVVLKKEYYQINLTDTQHYLVYQASSTQAARNFLVRRENEVTYANRYIRVETPEGTFCRDVDGIHEVRENEDSEVSR